MKQKRDMAGNEDISLYFDIAIFLFLEKTETQKTQLKETKTQLIKQME